MADKTIAFAIIARDAASPVFRSLGHNAESVGGTLTKFGAAIGAAVAAGSIASIKAASSYEEALTQLVTGAGESETAIKHVGDSMLKMAGEVGVGALELARGMYPIESAGYRAADGLAVLKASAQGAKIGATELGVVADGLTTIMTDYQIPTALAAETTSKLVKTVASGKTTMGDLAGAMSAVAPVAAAVGIAMEDMLGAMATMTGQGISAQKSAQNLSSTISSLANPTSVQTKAMAQMGLSSRDVAANLGKRGLSGTMELLQTAVMKHMGPSGLVLMNSFNQSKLAAESANEMLKKLPPGLQKVAKGFLEGSVSNREWRATLKEQPALIAGLGRQFARVAIDSKGFSNELRSGSGSAKTYAALMADMTGGATGLGVSLALTGSHLDTFKSNVEGIGAATADAKGNVAGWAMVQGDFDHKVEQTKAKLGALSIQLGTKLLPVVSTGIDLFTRFKVVTLTLAAVIGGAALIAMTAFLGNLVLSSAQMAIYAGRVVLVNAQVALFIAQQYALATAQKVAAAAQWVLNAAMSANPIGLIVIAVAALAAGLIYAYRNSATFRAVVQKAFSAVGAAAAAAGRAFGKVWGVIQGGYNWVRSRWPLLSKLLLGPFGNAVTLIVRKWDTILRFFGGMRSRIGRITRGMFDGIWQAFRGAINFVIRGWNRLRFTMPSIDTHIPGIGRIGGFSVGVPSIRPLAQGGIVKARPGGTLALIGEAGRDEAVVPLPSGSGGVGGEEVIHLHVYLDGKQVHESLLRRRRTTGQALGLG